MPSARPLRNPPIKEALIDIRIASNPKIDATALASLKKELASDFPKVEERKEFRAEVRVEAGRILAPSAHDLGFHGLIFTSSDGARLAQFRRDGFTLNQVKSPYPGADALIAEALRLWALFQQLTNPDAVIRVALRYINQLDLPYGPKDDFRKFLTVPADTPPETPQLV